MLLFLKQFTTTATFPIEEKAPNYFPCSIPTKMKRWVPQVPGPGKGRGEGSMSDSRFTATGQVAHEADIIVKATNMLGY